jgi:Zn-dependent protease with chaperone function
MPAVDFDFQRYVARRKGVRAAQVREGAAYAYPGDVRVLRTLDKLRPVRLALDETGRLWRHLARAELLGPAVRVTAERYPALIQAARRCSEILHIGLPALFIAPAPTGIQTLGTDEEAYIVVAQGLLEKLSPSELLDVLGRECGRLQNGHVPFGTALHYLEQAKTTLVRWAVRPATLTLQAWSRRADITADRAGLLCARDLDVSLGALAKAAAPSDAKALGRRQRALRRFASSAYYTTVVGSDSDEGESTEDCDAAVAAILDDQAPAAATSKPTAS